ncbi:hypothetical protein N7495_005468 [Penicillium taxi]|uniref:uncharacterized protein n=1 Tax=Penicillium taxi TaxID=168475 RepID=UPI0025457D71|nr:uncharacterized protein N7495_005468 [Penicillium taxi]KAJ5893777.1 hypothetical protein N7495_005468 [Penicillium taxi]
MGASTRSSHPKRPEGPVKIPGVLSQTISLSPVIRWILPARIRNNNRNDVVFVSEGRVQIKQALPGGYLQGVMEKTDFRGPIIAAKVLNVGTELSLETQIQTGDAYDGPSQILVLSIDMKELLFLYCSPSNKGEFVTFRRPLPVDIGLPLRFGRHIAVDPKSRAVAVSASNDFFGFLRLKSPHDLHMQMYQNILDPISQERFYRIDGNIQFMEFLYPNTVNDNRIMLLLIVQQDGVVKAVTYTWRENQGQKPEIAEFKLRKKDTLPTMVVPLTKECSFLLVTTTSMTVYLSDASSDDFSRSTKYPLIAPSADISEAAMWTRWARPARNWMYSQQHDGIYLCREDGWIYYLEFGTKGELESQDSLGQLNCDVDTAFDVLDMGYEGGDFILAAGSMGEGGLFVQEARDQPRCVQRFINWAPIRDAVMISSDLQSNSHGGISRNRLFACSVASSGHTESSSHGALHEFRYGIEAQLGITVPLDDLPNIRDMWIMSDDSNGGTYVLLSDHSSTLLLFINSEEEGISALDEDLTGLGTEQTIAAGCTFEGVIVQISGKATHLFVPHSTCLNACIPHDSSTSILAVAFGDSSSVIATAVRRDDNLYLYLSQIVATDDNIRLEVGQPTNINKDPVCLSLQKFGAMSFIFAGNVDGTISVFVLENETLNFLFETSILNTDADLSKVIESFAVIRTTTPNGSLRAFLLCGLRSGVLVSYEIDFNADDLIGLQQRDTNRIGTTSIQLQGQTSFALFTCNDELWHVSYNYDCIPSNYSIRRVWITDQNNPAWFPMTLHGFGLISQQGPESRSSLGHLFCFADQQLLICSLNREAKMVPRRIELPGRPKRLIYSPILRSLIVSYDIIQVADPEEAVFACMQRSYIEFIDPDSQQAVVHRDRAKMDGTEPWRPESGRGESINCILDWVFERDGQTYHMVAIGTSLTPSSHGRLILLSPRRDLTDPSRVNCVTQYTRRLDGPVRAMAAYRDSVLIGAGNLLIPVSAKNASTKWRRSAVGTLTSAVVSISIHDNIVFVMTARNSWTIFEVIHESGSEGADLKARSWDAMARDGLAHFVRPGVPPVVFMSHRGGRVSVARLQDKNQSWTDLNLEKSLREANLPESVLRFVSGSKQTDSMYGFSVHGSIYRFLLPTEDETKLLQLLQNICCKDESICPSLSKAAGRKNPLSLDNYHIDGDLLARLAHRGPEYLERLIESLGSSPTANPAHQLFNELALNLLGQTSTESVIAWMRKLLEVAV